MEIVVCAVVTTPTRNHCDIGRCVCCPSAVQFSARSGMEVVCDVKCGALFDPTFMSGICHAKGDKLIFYVLALTCGGFLHVVCVSTCAAMYCCVTVYRLIYVTGGVGFYMWCMFPHILLS